MILNPVPADSLMDIDIELEYTGTAIITPFGEIIQAGKPYTIRYNQFQVPVNWSVKWMSYDKQTDPQTRYDAFQRLLSTKKPFKAEKTRSLVYDWYGAFGKDMPKDSVATLAEGTFTIPKGNYQLHVTSDDGVRVWLDGKLVIDYWLAHEPEYKSVAVSLGGTHKLRVEHYEVNGFSTLAVGIKPEEEVLLK
jgi:hypothetical protein